MLIPRCCKNCPNRYSGICNCALPYYSDYVEDDNDMVYKKPIYNPILLEEKPEDIRIRQLEKEVKELSDKIKSILQFYKMPVEDFVLAQENYEKRKKEMNSKELAFNLYCALAEQLERDGADNIPSIIDQLVGKNCGKYADAYNEYKHLQKEVTELKEQIKELNKGLRRKTKGE